MLESHTGVNIAEVLLEAIEEWGIPADPPLVTDNATNMTTAAKEANFSIHIGCFAHTLNLACGRALKINNVARLLGRVRRIVAYFHRSPLAMGVLKEKQALLNLPLHKLIIDVQTRWNSAVDMVERFLEQQPAVYAALTAKELRGKDKSVATLAETDISNLEELQLILTPLRTATAALCEEKVPTLSIVLPLQHRLVHDILAGSAEDTEFVKSVKRAVSDDLEKRYTDEVIHKTLIHASLLDPRFKSLPFLSDAEQLEAYQSLTVEVVKCVKAREAAIQRIKQEPGQPQLPQVLNLPDLPDVPILNSSSDQEEESPPSPILKRIKQEPGTEKNAPERRKDSPKRESGAMSSLFGEVYIVKVEEAQPKSVVSRVEEEITRYKLVQPIPMYENPLKWWKSSEPQFRCIAMYARKILSIPATSVPSERVFSTAGDIVTAQRSALKSSHVDKLIFLKKNWNPS